MKGITYKGNKVSVSDSLHPKTLELHKRLVEKKKDLIKAGKWAYIPWSVPRVLKYKGRENAWRTQNITFVIYRLNFRKIKRLVQHKRIFLV